MPADNPFVGTTGADEIWALGLRNASATGFDRGLRDFYIADVGERSWEEIDFGHSGANYGWKVYRGPVPFSAGLRSVAERSLSPIFAMIVVSASRSLAATSYRGSERRVAGTNIFLPMSSTGKIFTLAESMANTWAATERTSQITADIGSINNPSSFGEDGRGDLYVVDFDGEIFRLTPTVVSADQPINFSEGRAPTCCSADRATII